MMFGLFHKMKDMDLYAPVSGEMIALDAVKDAVFSSRMMGDGVAFRFTDEVVCAPCDGTLTLITPTRHAFGMTMDNGAEVLVHIGLDTVNLNGEGFRVLAKQGAKIRKGTPVIAIDHAFMKQRGIDLTMPVVVTNSGDHPITTAAEGTVTCGESKIITFR